jgi:prolyl oligopeptidase
VLHGVRVPDPYRWLEDADDPGTKAWSAAQDELFAAHAATWPGRAHVAGTITALLATGSVGVPASGSRRRPPAAPVRREPTAEHGVLLLRTTADGIEVERVLVDPVELDPSGATTLDAWSCRARATCWPTRSARAAPRRACCG